MKIKFYGWQFLSPDSSKKLGKYRNFANSYNNDNYWIKFGLRSEKLYFFSPFRKKSSLLNENVHTEVDVTDEIWREIFLIFSAEDSEYLIGFLNTFWEHWEPDLIFRLLNWAFFVIFDCFPLFWENPWKRITDGNELNWKSSQNEFGTKRSAFRESTQTQISFFNPTII